MTPIHINSEFAEWVLVWIGFGTLVGLAAKLLSPGRDPGGSIMTLMIGILGTLIGCSVLAFLKQDTSSITPISVQGFPCGVAGAFVLLMTYRLLGGYYFEEGEDGVPLRARRRRRRRYVNYE